MDSCASGWGNACDIAHSLTEPPQPKLGFDVGGAMILKK